MQESIVGQIVDLRFTVNGDSLTTQFTLMTSSNESKDFVVSPQASSMPGAVLAINTLLSIARLNEAILNVSYEMFDGNRCATMIVILEDQKIKERRSLHSKVRDGSYDVTGTVNYQCYIVASGVKSLGMYFNLAPDPNHSVPLELSCATPETFVPLVALVTSAVFTRSKIAARYTVSNNHGIVSGIAAGAD